MTSSHKLWVEERPCAECRTIIVVPRYGRRLCDPCLKKKRSDPKKFERHMTALEVDAYLQAARQRETAMPWERP